jgi:protein TonB
MRLTYTLAMLVASLTTMAQEGDPDIRLVPMPPDEPAVIDTTPWPEVPDSNQVLIVVEEMPSFPGGMPSLSAYVSEHLKYPEKAKKLRVEGLVLLQFTVEKDGSVSNVEVIRGIGYGCDEEALRVVKAMPAWKPGQQVGKPVRVRYSLPIRFKLTD